MAVVDKAPTAKTHAKPAITMAAKIFDDVSSDDDAPAAIGAGALAERARALDAARGSDSDDDDSDGAVGVDAPPAGKHSAQHNAQRNALDLAWQSLPDDVRAREGAKRAEAAAGRAARSELELELAAAKGRLLGVDEDDDDDEDGGARGWRDRGAGGADAYAELLPGAGGFGLADMQGGSDDEEEAVAEARGRVVGADGKLSLVVDASLGGVASAGGGDGGDGQALSRKQRRELLKRTAAKRPQDPDRKLDQELSKIEKLLEEKAQKAERAAKRARSGPEPSP